MRLLEFEAKEILKKYGIELPAGQIVSAVNNFNFSVPVVLKAQVPVGGRSKAGAIQHVSSIAEAKATANTLLSMEVKGYSVKAVLAEEICCIEKEYYLACLSDKELNRFMIIASAAGGIDIEVMIRKSQKKQVNIFIVKNLRFMGAPFS